MVLPVRSVVKGRDLREAEKWAADACQHACEVLSADQPLFVGAKPAMDPVVHYPLGLASDLLQE